MGQMSKEESIFREKKLILITNSIGLKSFVTKDTGFLIGGVGQTQVLGTNGLGNNLSLNVEYIKTFLQNLMGRQSLSTIYTQSINGQTAQCRSTYKRTNYDVLLEKNSSQIFQQKNSSKTYNLPSRPIRSISATKTNLFLNKTFCIPCKTCCYQSQSQKTESKYPRR